MLEFRLLFEEQAPRWPNEEIKHAEHLDLGTLEVVVESYEVFQAKDVSSGRFHLFTGPSLKNTWLTCTYFSSTTFSPSGFDRSCSL